MSLHSANHSGNSDDDISQDVITLLVGESKDPVILSRDMLCVVSKYFDRALKGNFIEAGRITYTIPDFQVRTVKRFQAWLYRGALSEDDDPKSGCGYHHGPCKGVPVADKNIPFQALTQEQDEEMENLISHHEATPLSYLYVFADRYDIPLLRMHTIDKLWRQALNGILPWYASVIYAWRNLTSSSPLIRLMLDVMVLNWDAAADHQCPTEALMRQKVPAELFYHLARKLQEFQMMNHDEKAKCAKGYLKHLCTYHEHDQTEEVVEACDSAKGAREYLEQLGRKA